MIPAEDLDRVRALGYDVEVTVPTRRGGTRRGGDLRVSIAMCTYQGERFLPEQLDSIAGQTRLPDEMVVCDDGSTDGTVGLLESFAADAGFPVKVIRNERNLGSTKNFEQAIGAVSGDVIALSDQDDVWHAGKLATIEEALEADQGASAVFTDADLIDDASRSTGYGLWDTIGFTRELRRRVASGDAVPQLLVGNVVTGAALAFRSSFRDLVLPIPQGWVQDAWIGLLLAAAGRLLPLDDSLIRYRVHQAQQIGVPPARSRLDMFRHRMQLGRRALKQERPVLMAQAEAFSQAAERLRSMADRYPCPPGVLEDIEEKVRHFRVRGAMLEDPHRWRSVSREWSAGAYGRYSHGAISAAKDLLLPDRLGGRT
jgi:hypothetical protein